MKKEDFTVPALLDQILEYIETLEKKYNLKTIKELKDRIKNDKTLNNKG